MDNQEIAFPVTGSAVRLAPTFESLKNSGKEDDLDIDQIRKVVGKKSAAFFLSSQ